MAQSDKVRAFKNELKNYNYYKFKIDALSKDIEYCYHILGGVRGVDPSKEPIHCMPNKDNEYRVREDISNYEAKLDVYKQKVGEIERVLSLLPDDARNVVKDVYFNNKTYDYVALKYYMSKSTINFRINKELEKVLD